MFVRFSIFVCVLLIVTVLPKNATAQSIIVLNMTSGSCAGLFPYDERNCNQLSAIIPDIGCNFSEECEGEGEQAACDDDSPLTEEFTPTGADVSKFDNDEEVGVFQVTASGGFPLVCTGYEVCFRLRRCVCVDEGGITICFPDRKYVDNVLCDYATIPDPCP